MLQTAIDVAAAPGLIDFRDGSIQTTGRDLDVALEGRGFFEIETPKASRYTRNGQFSRRPDGTLVTADGAIVRGDGGAPITVGAGRHLLRARRHGARRRRRSPASSRSSTSATTSACAARKRGRFRAEAGSTPVDAPTTSRVRGGSLEQSNVALAERMVQLTEVSRAFEALQRGITTLMNDVDGRAISELGRR